MKLILYALAILCLTWPQLLNAQGKRGQSNNVRLIKSLPSVYLSFEKKGHREPLEEGESSNGIWLRFHNNTKWRIGVCTFSVRQEYGDEGFFYEVERADKENAETDNNFPIGYRKKGGCLEILLPPGKSLLFSVPEEHLAEGLAVSVDFRYEWESNLNIKDGQEPTHQAKIYAADIPKTAHQRQKI